MRLTSILNPLSIHITFTAIVPGAYPSGRPKCAKQANLAYRRQYLVTYLLYRYVIYNLYASNHLRFSDEFLVIVVALSLIAMVIVVE